MKFDQNVSFHLIVSLLVILYDADVAQFPNISTIAQHRRQPQYK